MKNFKIILVFLFISSSVSANSWYTDFENAKRVAITTNKLILIDFWATWCGPCKKMDRESWTNAEVQQLMQNYVPVKLDIDRQKSLAKYYQVKAIPYVFIVDGNGHVVYQQMSYMRKPAVLKLLNKFALNTKYLNADLINFYNKENFVTSFRLGEKYQNYSMYLKDNLPKHFLKTSSSYFTLAEKHIAKSDMKNKDLFLQKIDLFEIQAHLILGKFKKANKSLSKIKINEINPKNLRLYNILSFVVHEKLEDGESVKYKEQLTENDLKKADLIIKAS